MFRVSRERIRIAGNDAKAFGTICRAKVQNAARKCNLARIFSYTFEKEDFEMEKLIAFIKDEDGATLVEYGLLVALIAVALVGAIGGLATALDTLFDSAAGELN